MSYKVFFLWGGHPCPPIVQERTSKAIPQKYLSIKASIIACDINQAFRKIKHTQKYLMIVVNHNRHQSNLTIKLTQKLAGKAVAINQETITNLSAQASFDIILSPYEIRLYQIG